MLAANLRRIRNTLAAQTIYFTAMRKWIALLVFLALIFAAIYLLIPSKITVDDQVALPVNAKALSRNFFDEQNWLQWWPGEKPTSTIYPVRFIYNGKTYTLLQKRFSSYVLSVSEGKDSLLTELVLLPVQNGTAQASWLASGLTGYNPLTRIRRYWKAKALASDLPSLLDSLKVFYADEDRLYGFHFKEGIVTDSLLVSTAIKVAGLPSNETVYALVDKLQAFIKKNGAEQTAPPMLNVFKNTDSGYTTRVALPVNKHLKDEGDIQFKQMLGKGNIMVTEVKGGPAHIQKAFDQMQNFIEDNRRTAPAIEFQSLITDRRTEPDTSKWITKLYWPVM